MNVTLEAEVITSALSNLPANLTHDLPVREITDAIMGALANATNTSHGEGLSDDQDWNLDLVQWLWFASGVSAAIAAIWSFHTMDQHIRYNKHGVMRAYVVRILFMVPIYAMAAWLGLIQENFSVWWNVVREVYEAFTIYSFIWFLLAYLGGEAEVKKLVRQRYSAGRRLIHHMWPWNKCCKGPANPDRFMPHVKIGVMQYVVVQVITALLTVYLTAVGRFHEGRWAINNAYPWFVVIKNFSQTWALYCLVWFYHSLHAELSGCNPLPKAMCIKGVVFFTYWQSVVFSVCANFGLLHGLEQLESQDVATSLQNFIICFEMLVAAILHAVYFPYAEFNTLPARDAEIPSDIEAHSASPGPPPFEAVRDHLMQHLAQQQTPEGDPKSPAPSSPSPVWQDPLYPAPNSPIFDAPRSPLAKPPSAVVEDNIDAEPGFDDDFDERTEDTAALANPKSG